MAKRMGYALAYPFQFDINRIRSRLPGGAILRDSVEKHSG